MAAASAVTQFARRGRFGPPVLLRRDFPDRLTVAGAPGPWSTGRVLSLPEISPAEQPPEVHVLPHARSGGWKVTQSNKAAALSWHGSAGEALRAAQRVAARRNARSVYLHDRYERVRAINP